MNRLFTGWTWTRALFLFIGILVLGQGIDANQWLGVALGIYIGSLGLFGLGCASENCSTSNCRPEYDPDQEKN